MALPNPLHDVRPVVLTPKGEAHVMRVLFAQAGTARIVRTSGELSWRWPAYAAAVALGASRPLRLSGPLPNVALLSPDAEALGEPAPVDPQAVKHLASLGVAAPHRVVYALRWKLASARQTRRGWNDPENNLWWPVAHVEALIWATSPDLLNAARTVLQGERGPRLMFGRDLVPVLLPRSVLLTAPAVTIAPPPVPQRQLRPPTPRELALGQREDGDLMAFDVEGFTHAAVFGLSGGGKTTSLRLMILSDILCRPHQGLILMDPAAGLAADVAPWVPADRTLVTIDLGDESQPSPWAWNPLAPAREVKPHVIIRGVTAALAAALNWPAHARVLIRTAHLVIRTAVELNAQLPADMRLTLLDLPELIEGDLRQLVPSRLPHLASAWERASKEALGAIVDTMEELQTEPPVAAFFGRSVSTWDPRISLDRGDVVLIQPGKAMNYLGAALIANGIVAAALARTDIPRAERRPARFVIDEAQVIAPSMGRQLVRVLEEARQFGLFLTLGTQSPLRLGDLLLHAVLLNAAGGLIATMRLDAAGSRRLAAEWPDISADELLNLKSRHGLVRAGIDRPRPFTTLLPDQLWARPELWDRAGADGPDETTIEREIAARPGRILTHLGGTPGAGRGSQDGDAAEDPEPVKLPTDERRRIVRDLVYRRGYSQRRAAKELGVHLKTIQRDLDPSLRSSRSRTRRQEGRVLSLRRARSNSETPSETRRTDAGAPTPSQEEGR
jgi:hypothetical protein